MKHAKINKHRLFVDYLLAGVHCFVVGFPIGLFVFVSFWGGRGGNNTGLVLVLIKTETFAFL